MDRVTLNKDDVRRKPNNIIPVPTDHDFFKWWCTFMRAFVKLTDKEIEVISSLLKQRYELSKVISDPAVLDSQMMGNDVKNKVIEECHITSQHYDVMKSKLRKNNVIINNVIQPRLIPNIRPDDNGTFSLMIVFKEKQS